MTKNEENKIWEKSEKNKIRDLFEKKFEGLPAAKRGRFIQNATVLHKNEEFYENSCRSKYK